MKRNNIFKQSVFTQATNLQREKLGSDPINVDKQKVKSTIAKMTNNNELPPPPNNLVVTTLRRFTFCLVIRVDQLFQRVGAWQKHSWVPWWDNCTPSLRPANVRQKHETKSKSLMSSAMENVSFSLWISRPSTQPSLTKMFSVPLWQISLTIDKFKNIQLPH